MRDAIARAIVAMPEQLRRSLTWDQGAELAQHARLTIDTGARVLRADGTPVPALFAAGSDAGGAFGRGYAGGLALAATFGITAARSAGWA